MDKWIRFSGILGLVIFGFGFISALLMQDFTIPLLVLHMIVGLGLIFTWIFGFGARNVGDAASEALRGRTARFSANAFLYTAVFLGFLVVINYFAARFDKRWDLTDDNVFSLSQQSETILKNLKRPLLLVAFKGTAQVDEVALSDLFKLYEHANPSLVKTQIIDPRSKPQLVEQYEMKAANKIYLEYGEGTGKQVSRVNTVNEEEITNAILKMARGAAKKVYYIEGHDEPDINDAGTPVGLKKFAESIADEHMTLEGLVLLEKTSIPEDAAALILCSPKKSLLEEEKKLLRDYVNAGGRLIMFTDPRTTNDVKSLAADFNIEVGDNVIIDQVQQLLAAPVLGAQPIVRTYAPHPITQGLSTRHITIFNIASSVKAKSGTAPPLEVTEFAKTSETSWAEIDLGRVFDQEEAQAEFDPKNDIGGPVSLAAAFQKKLGGANESAEKKDDEFVAQSRVVVFGDSDFIMNGNLGISANRELALKAINWVVGQEGGVSLPPKTRRGAKNPVPRDVFTILLALGLMVPETILIVGLLIWWRRKTIAA